MVGLRLVTLAALLTLGSCCQNPFLQIGSQCLFFGSSFSFDYTASADFCTALNGRLVTIDNTQKLRDIVDYTTNNLTQDYSYWVDGTDVQGNWLFADGTSIPRGTPYWATYSINGSGYGQQPVESQQQGTNCLAIKYQSSFYFVSNDCGDSISPLCEEMEGLEEVGVFNAVNTRIMTSREEDLGTSNSLTKFTCGGELTSFSGEISSPNYPDFPPVSDCVWTITRTTDSVIRITIKYAYITTTEASSYLEIRDGSDINSPLFGRYNSATSCPLSLVTSGHQAYIRYFANYISGAYNGFDLEWETEWNGNCRMDYNSSSGYFNSPWYPNTYPTSLDCAWTITVKEGEYITLTTASFDTEEDTDIVQIRDGADSTATLLKEMSGYIETGIEVTSTTNQLFVSFTSDGSNFGPGFAFAWTSKELCPTPYLNVGKLCIHFELNDLTFGLSGIACQEESGELAAINDPQDLRDLYLFLQNQGIADTSFWLGGSDQAEEGVWRWKDGSLVPIGTPFWGTTGGQSEVQEPDGGAAENCLLLASNGMHYFRDEACNKKAPAICMLSAQ